MRQAYNWRVDRALAWLVLSVLGSGGGPAPHRPLLPVPALNVADAAGPQAAPVRSAPINITANARAIQPGELVVLTLTTTSPADAVHVRIFDRDVAVDRLDALRWRALVGIDLDVAPRTYTATVDATIGSRREEATHALVVRPKHFPTRALKVDPAFVTPPAAMEARIVSEAAELEELWRHSSATRLWTMPFVRPVPAQANSAFGSRSVFNGVVRSPHGGADFPSATGTSIAAPNAGRIVLAKELYFSGNTVVIDHGMGLFSTLAHLSAFAVHEGDTVTVGQRVGSVGATGRVTGPHLHWAIRLDGARVDPLAVLALLGRQAP
jgi:murein DD-endopeptidase MepM/ murein hydrolase activator NlpD